MMRFITRIYGESEMRIETDQVGAEGVSTLRAARGLGLSVLGQC